MTSRARLRIAVWTTLFVNVAAAVSAAADCRDVPGSLSYWRPIRENPDAAVRPADELAIELVPCLASPDGELRDGIGYELFTYWLRNDRLSDDARRELLQTLQRAMADPRPAIVLKRSFSALILAEIVRSDGARPFMNDDERGRLLVDALEALGNETDFRGLDPEVGWVHPIAHLGDVAWRFALHPATTRPQATEILAALRERIGTMPVAWTQNEGDRLARAAATIVRRQLVPAESVGGWLDRFSSPATMSAWTDAFASPQGMIELHNTKQFLRALSDQLENVDTAPGIREPLSALVADFTNLI